MRQPQKYLEKTIGYKFQSPDLLTMALTHRSYAEHNNERLEFLGDALLDMFIAEALYYKFPKASEGQLTRLRSNLVNKDALAELATKFEISKYILLGDGELKSGGLQRVSILADCLEAIMAAIYQDSGFEACRKSVLNWYENKINALEMDDFGKDAKTILQEWLQSKKYDLPVYTIESEIGQAHDRTFTIKCYLEKLNISTIGSGGSRRKAEQQSAKQAMEIILNKDGNND